ARGPRAPSGGRGAWGRGRGLGTARPARGGRRAGGVPPPISSPRNLIEPSLGASAPETQLNAVVLPDPLGPINPRISPSRTSNETLFSAVNPPNRFVSPATVSIASGIQSTAFERRLRRRHLYSEGGGIGGGL